MSAAGSDPKSRRKVSRRKRAATVERRDAPRLRLAYAVRLDRPGERGAGRVVRELTEDLSSRGLFVCAQVPDDLAVGQSLDVRMTVPHRVGCAGREVRLALNGTGRVVRLVPPGDHALHGENGIARTGVAVEFDAPLVIDHGSLA